MHRTGGGFRATQVGGAHLDAGRPERHGGPYTLGIGDTASGDHRHPHCLDDLRQQGDCAELATQVHVQEHAAMTASFQALGNDRIRAMGFQPERLLDGGRRAEDFRPASPYPIQ
ncbi:hypothetical protein D9M68_840080 [compost metagenome]